MNEVELSSPELEAAVLGAILVHNGLYQQINLKPKDFYIHRHRWIWEAMCTLLGNGLVVDHLTLPDELERKGKLGEIGGVAYLAKITHHEGNTYHAPQYAGQLRDLTNRRNAFLAGQELARAAFNTSEPLEVKQTEIIAALNRNSPLTGAVHVSEWVQETLKAIKERAEKGETEMLMTGYGDWDKFIGGLDPSEGTQMILGGEPGAGKTILLGNVSYNLAEKTPGALYSMEMKRKRMMMRSFSARSRVSAWDMRRGKLQDDEWEKLETAAEDYNRLSLFVSDASSWNTATLRGDLTRLKYEHGIKWYAVDYLKLLSDEVKGAKEHERLEEISGRLLKINRDLGLCSIIIHTMTKDNFRKDNLNGGAFAGGAGLQYDMDIGAVLVKSDVLHGGVFEYRKLIFTKNRDGETPLGELELAKYPKIPLFVTPSIRTESQKSGLNGHAKELVRA